MKKRIKWREKAFGLRIFIITRAISIMERKKERRNNRKEYYCHGASCMQANDAEGRKDDRLKEKERERRKDPTGVDTAIYSKKRGAPA